MIAKAGLGLIGLGAISIGGVAVTKPHWLGMDYMPKYKVLSQEGNFTGTYTNGKFGNKYGKYLASSGQDNKSWWDWAYRRLSKEKISSGKFTNQGTSDAIKVSDAYAENSGGNNDKALNQVCKAAYGTEESSVENSPSSSNDKFNKSEVWKYCSPVGQKPTTVKEYDNKDNNNLFYKDAGSGGNNPIGKEGEDVLISVNDDNNQVFWDIRNQEFHGKDLFQGKTQTFDNSKHVFFKTKQGLGDHIKDICKEAYKQTKANPETSSTSQATTEETKKFCSLIIS